MNKVFLFGKAGQDATEKTQDFVTFTLATSENRKTQEGKWETQTTWHNVVCGKFTAQKAKEIKKGDSVLVEGKIRIHEYNNQKYFQIEAATIQVIKTEKKSEPKPFADDQIPF